MGAEVDEHHREVKGEDVVLLRCAVAEPGRYAFPRHSTDESEDEDADEVEGDGVGSGGAIYRSRREMRENWQIGLF